MGEGVGWFKRTALKHVYYLGWNRSPAQVGCMRQVLGSGALGRPRGSRWRARWEGGSGWETHVNPWPFHFNVWQNSLQIKKKTNYTIHILPVGTHALNRVLITSIECLESLCYLFWVCSKCPSISKPSFFWSMCAGTSVFVLCNIHPNTNRPMP